MVPQPRGGPFSLTPSVRSIQTGNTHSPHITQNTSGPVSATASPGTNSPTGSNSLVVAQVYFLLGFLKDDTDRAKWESQVEQLRKLVKGSGMEVFSKFFGRLVVANASHIFPALSRTAQSPPPSTYQVLSEEMQKLLVDPEQASKIAEAIETGSEDIFRDFDLSTFMDHFKLDPLEKTILGLAFKPGNRPDLRTKVDAILSANFTAFTECLSHPMGPHHEVLDPEFISLIVDRFLQYPPPNFSDMVKQELSHKVLSRYGDQSGIAPPVEIVATLDLIRVLEDKPENSLTLQIKQVGSEFTKDEASCVRHLQAAIGQSRPGAPKFTEAQVASALSYCYLSQNPTFNPSVLVSALMKVLPAMFEWPEVIRNFDHPSARITSQQFLVLYNALLPLAQDSELQPPLDLQALWGGNWTNSEAVLSFVCAFASHTPDTLDASTIPGLVSSIEPGMYTKCSQFVQERAQYASKHPLSSVSAISAVFHAALDSNHASQSTEAKRLFQEVVLPNIDLFAVSSFSVPKPWPIIASETVVSLFTSFYQQNAQYRDFVFESLWRKDSEWVVRQLMDRHATQPTELPRIFELALTYGWLDVLVNVENGFGIDLAAYAHSQGSLDLEAWASRHQDNSVEMANNLIQFLTIKAGCENSQDVHSLPTSTPLHIKTVFVLLGIIDGYMNHVSSPSLSRVQRLCVTAYPRLVNYGQGFDDIIDSNSSRGNQLPAAANSRMEEHYKRMYNGDVDFKEIVSILQRYKVSRDHLDQDAFACMIHGLFDEFTHYKDYPLEALATTAVLFGGIISYSLVSGVPLKIALEMILESVRDYSTDRPMFKFGIQALKTLSPPRLREFHSFRRELAQVIELHDSPFFAPIRETLQRVEEEAQQAAVNDNPLSPGQPVCQPFAAIHVGHPEPHLETEQPGDHSQDRFKFLLNNVSEEKLAKTCEELRSLLEPRYMQWFAVQLVEERAKGQPNYHGLVSVGLFTH